MTTLQRGLKSRHLMMIAIGGSIGTGIFLGSGAAISAAGPGGAIVAYLAIGAMVYFMMTSLGEMASYFPISGSFSTYASQFVDPALGFALGWNFWFSWAITIATELSAASLLMKFWFPDVSSGFWSAIFLVVLCLLNALAVRGYGESEYWISFVKVATVIIFIILGLLMIFGIMGGEAVGFKNMHVGDGPFHGGVLSIIGIFMIAGFSFQGTELVGIAAGESEDPRRNVPRAIKRVFWRILLFYVFSILVMGLLIPFTDPRLLQSDLSHVTMSPFTLIFEKAGLAFAASVMNAVILSSVLSAGNSGMYAATRMLWVLAKEKKAPKFLQKLNRYGVPIYAMLFTAVIGAFTFLASFFGDGTVFLWLLNASGLTGFIIWLGIALCHYRFRKAFIVQGKSLEKLPYKARWYPFGPLFAIGLSIIVIFGQNYGMFLAKKIDWVSVVVSYSGIPVFLILWLGYKWTKKTRMVPLKDVNLDTIDK